jgi:excinuclease ABC subunit A
VSERATPPDLPDAIRIVGAREHNLKNLTVAVPRGRFVVITGVSGSGKSTLAFDLLFAEGQRRFMDSMNTYARQFVEQMPRPDVDVIEGLPPTVSIEQRHARGGGKSTVATVTEIHHFLRLLFARLGVAYCPDCQIPVAAQTRDQLERQLQKAWRQRGDLQLLAPVVKNRKGFHSDVALWAAQHGYPWLRADGRMSPSVDGLRLDRFREHNVEILVGVLGLSRRASASFKPPEALIEKTLELGHGTLLALDHRGKVSVHSTARTCARCERSFAPLDPKDFSYNSPQGWCPRCRGFGELFYLPDVDRGARADAIEESWFGWQEGEREPCPECHGHRLNALARAVRLPLPNARHPLTCLGKARALANPDSSRPGVDGSRPLPTLADFGGASVDAAHEYFRTLRVTGREALVARDILPEIRERLRFLREVGLGYLQLSRAVPTLSGGEAQRVRLSAQLGSNLSGVLYILDEPTIGLHARDNEQLLATLARLRARGNSLVVVEHDEATMRHADHVIDLGPGAGVHGGEVVASGTLAELQRHPESVTGQCLRQARSYPRRGARRPVSPNHPRLTLSGAAAHNLQNLTVQFPLGRLVLVTGVSGSGKSSLVRECLFPALQAGLRPASLRPASLRRAVPRTATHNTTSAAPAELQLTGFQSLKAVFEVDQSPIGRTPRSVPATYVGFFDDIRALFAQVPEARLRGYTASRFSFNSPQGRCPECEGAGSVKLEMNFLPAAFVKCEVCDGRRFSRETLDVELGGRNIAQVLDLSVEEALGHFAAFPRIRRPLEALRDTGLGYLKLGQTSPTLSGGEAQRVKLVTHLLSGLRDSRPGVSPAPPGQDAPRSDPASLAAARTPDGLSPSDEDGAGVRGPSSAASHSAFPAKRNLFILEEPTIGLHMADVCLLMDVLHRLIDAGHSVLVIEHNLDLIAEADWIIDLGPEGGDGGGRIVVEGTPEQVARCARSHTGRFLRQVLSRERQLPGR